MKRFITTIALMSLMATALPSYSMWYCQATNLRQSGVWTGFANKLHKAKDGALMACASSYGTNGSPQQMTHNPNTCHILSCQPQPFQG